MVVKAADGSDNPEKETKGDAVPSHRLRVLVVRHAVAEERGPFGRTGQPEAARPLTRGGRRKMRRAARGLACLVPRLDRLATSPLTRAVETADIVARACGKPKTQRLAPLAPGKPPGGVLAWLKDQRPGGTVALVGHEPDLGVFVSWALTGLRESFVPLKKGGACLLEFGGEVKPGRAVLLWLLRPSQLRAVGE